MAALSQEISGMDKAVEWTDFFSKQINLTRKADGQSGNLSNYSVILAQPKSKITFLDLC